MTPSEHTDVARFPLTTWPGLTVQAQALTDACGLEELRVLGLRWNKLTRLQRGQLAELTEKAGR
jgi:hypothetical protein